MPDRAPARHHGLPSRAPAQRRPVTCEAPMTLRPTAAVAVTLTLAWCAVAGLAAPAYARVEDEPPKTTGSSYAAATKTLVAWWPTVRIEVSGGVPDGTDPAQVFVDAQTLVNP